MPSELAAALAKVQGELKPIKRATKGQRSKYADLATVENAVFPLLSKHGIAFIAKPTWRDDRFVLAYSLVHGPSGEREDGEYPMHGNGTDQQRGSEVTYARRYTLCAITGAAPEGEDDDGAVASERRQQPMDSNRVRTAHTDPEHARLVYGTADERLSQRPAERRRQPDPDDPWAGDPPEDAPGSIAPQQRTRIMAALSALGIKDRQKRLDVLSDVTGRTVESTNDLSMVEATNVEADLKGRKEAKEAVEAAQ